MRKILALMLICMFALCACAQAEGMPVAEDIAVENGGWQNILLLGGDSRSTYAYERTDSMMIISINRDGALVKMTSIMRDTWVEIPGHESKAKINAANVYGGPELAIKTVNQCFGTDIEDYVIVNMEDMKTIINLMGGVDVEISDAERNQINKACPDSPYLGSAGTVHLNGEQALSFCRIRYIDNDYRRVMRQQKVLLAMAEKAQNMDVDELTEIMGDVQDSVLSNMEKADLEDLATAFMVMEIEDVEQFRIPADGTFESGMYDGVWCIRPNFEENRKLLNEFIYG